MGRRTLVALGGVASLALGAGGAYFLGPILMGADDTEHVSKTPLAELRIERSERAYPLSGVVTVGSHPLDYAIVTAGTESRTTDETGAYSFTSAPLGEITVTRPGYYDYKFNFDGSGMEADPPMNARIVRGIRVSPEAAKSDTKFQELLDLAASTTINAFLFDTKGDYDYGSVNDRGVVFYETDVEAAQKPGLVVVWYDPVQRIQQAKDAGLYTITRIPVFISYNYVTAYPEHKLVDQYLDPGNRDAWEYALDLAVEACEKIGFDEIQFDYIRYPDGQAASQARKLGLIPDEATRIANVQGFLQEAADRLHPFGCAVSADSFGGITIDPGDYGVGQRLEEFSAPLDAYSPMTYPNLWGSGGLGFSNPNAHPKEVVAAQLDGALSRVAEWVAVRPLLQSIGYTNAKIRSEIDAAEERHLGWIIWNMDSNYSAGAFPAGTTGEG
jgi:hypothetical protein